MESTQQINQLFLQNPWIIWALIAIALWTIPWKGYALWKSARQSEKWWFIALLLVNTLGILEILYIFVFSKKNKTPEPTQESPKM